MYSLLQKATLFVVNVILVLALLLFASGFFPHKALLPGLAQWSERDCTGAIDAQFDRVVFMVVDALRRSIPARNFGLYTSNTILAILFSLMLHIFISRRGMPLQLLLDSIR